MFGDLHEPPLTATVIFCHYRLSICLSIQVDTGQTLLRRWSNGALAADITNVSYDPWRCGPASWLSQNRLGRCAKETLEILLHREGQQYSRWNICLYMVLNSRFGTVCVYIETYILLKTYCFHPIHHTRYELCRLFNMTMVWNLPWLKSVCGRYVTKPLNTLQMVTEVFKKKKKKKEKAPILKPLTFIPSHFLKCKKYNHCSEAERLVTGRALHLTWHFLHTFSPPHAVGHAEHSSLVPRDPQHDGERDTRQEGFKGPGSGNELKLCTFSCGTSYFP